MQRITLLSLTLLIAAMFNATAQPGSKSVIDSLYKPREIPRAIDSTLTQKYVSEFGYSFMLPAKAKFNTIGSAVNKPGETQMANFMLTGGAGALKIWNYKETQVVPPNYKVIDSAIFYDKDSAGVNGKLHTRTYILDSIVVRIEALLTPKGEAEYGSRLLAIFDSFVAPPAARKEMPLWRFEYGRFHNGRNYDDWEAPK